jgi:hypothetical protein
MFSRNANRFIGYTLALFMVGVAETFAQSWDVHVNAGFATYSHPELRAYQDYLLREFVVESKATERFPPYITYSLGVNKNWTRWNLGIEFGHGSTGGRIYYEDYSGKIIADQLVTYNYLGITPSIVLHNNDKLIVTGGIRVSMIVHELTIRNDLTVGNETLHEEVEFLTDNLGFQPHVRIRKDITSRLFIQGSVGYEIQDSRETISPDRNAAFLADEKGEPVHLQGSGLRLYIGTGVRF